MIKSAFTLIEMLVIVAIIAILLAMLSPSARLSVIKSEMTECANNERQLTLAWQQYSVEHQMILVESNTNNGCWVASGSQGGNTIAGMTFGVLWPYILDIDIYSCPTPVYDYYITYALSGMLHGEGGMTGKVYMWMHIINPSEVMCFIEEDDYRGYNMNSFMCSAQPGKWIDYVAGNHDGGDNISFCDGHVEYHKWLDPDTLTFPYPPNGGPRSHGYTDPGSVDVEYLQGIFWQY